MDYSLLLGVHVLDQRDGGDPNQQAGGDGKRPVAQRVLYSTAMESIQGDGKAAEALTTDDTWVASAGRRRWGRGAELCTHIWACTHTASVYLLVPHLFFFSLSEAPLHNRGSQSAWGLTCSHIHGYTQHKHTAATMCIYCEGFECKCLQSSSLTNICEAASEQRCYLNSMSSNEGEDEGGADVLCVFHCVFQDGWHPGQNTQGRKAAYLPGYHRHLAVIQVLLICLVLLAQRMSAVSPILQWKGR